MNEKQQFKILSAISFVVISLSVAVSSFGIYMFLNLGRLSVELPVKTVDQMRNIANIMPLVSELTSDVDAVQERNQSIDRGKLRFTVNKLEVTRSLIDADFDGAPPTTCASSWTR